MLHTQTRGQVKQTTIEEHFEGVPAQLNIGLHGLSVAQAKLTRNNRLELERPALEINGI